MTQQQINQHVENKINNDRMGGYDIEQLWNGIHPDQRFQVVFAIKSLLESGKIEITSKRILRGGLHWEEVTSYRKV